MLGKLLNFRRRTKSQYVDDKAVEDFTRVLDQVFDDPKNAGQHLDDLAKMTGARGTKAKPAEGEHLLYSFLTCEPNAVVEPIHPKAMPVILHEDDWDTWLNADAKDALRLQRPWPDDQLQIVARGPSKSDQHADA